MSKPPFTPPKTSEPIPPLTRNDHFVEHSVEGAPPLLKDGQDPIPAAFSRLDTTTGKIFDYYPRTRTVDATVLNEMGGRVPAKVDRVTWMRRARPGQRDPFASMGVRATPEVK